MTDNTRNKKLKIKKQYYVSAFGLNKNIYSCLKILDEVQFNCLKGFNNT